jgi:hypothetical protein
MTRVRPAWSFVSAPSRRRPAVEGRRRWMSGAARVAPRGRRHGGRRARDRVLGRRSRRRRLGSAGWCRRFGHRRRRRGPGGPHARAAVRDHRSHHQRRHDGCDALSGPRPDVPLRLHHWQRAPGGCSSGDHSRVPRYHLRLQHLREGPGWWPSVRHHRIHCDDPPRKVPPGGTVDFSWDGTIFGWFASDAGANCQIRCSKFTLA